MSLNDQTPPDDQTQPAGLTLYDGGHKEGWPEVDMSLMEDVRGDVPAFPLDLLPPAWAQWVSDTAKSAGAPVDYVAQGLLASVAAVCGTGVQAQVSPAWSEPLVLWQALVGAPSSGKSPALSAARRQIAQMEEALRAGDAERQGRHAAQAERAELLTQRWKKECQEAMEQGRDTPLKPDEASFTEAFVPSQLVVADATLEALADVVAGNPRGVVMWRDELSAWLANQGRYANGGSDRAHWLEAWAGAGITINRRTRSAPLHLDRFPVSIVGTIQPDRIAEAFAGSDDGMAARFLYAWPDLPDYIPLMQRPVPNDDDALALLQRIASVAGPAERPRQLVFEPRAVDRFDQLLRQIHAESEETDRLEAGWVGKGRGTVARLAAALTLLEWSERPAHSPGPSAITHRTIEQAARLWSDYFRPHARAVFNQAGRADRDRHARRVVRWLRMEDYEEVGREAIRREALCFAVDAEGADRVIARLEGGGLLRKRQTTTTGKGRPARRWEVNPALRR